MKPVYTDITLPVSGMSCAACAASVESMLTSLNGVFSASVNYATSTVQIRFNPLQVSLDQFQAALKPIGYDLVISGDDEDEAFEQLELKRHSTLRRRLVVAAIFSLPVFIISMLWHHPSVAVQWLLLALSLPVIFYSGQGFYLNVFRLGVRGKTNMDTLVAIGTAAAFALSLINTIFPDFIPGDGITAYVYYESAVVIITLILLGRYLEERSRGKASAAISKLMHLQPQTAIRLKGNIQEEVAIRHLLPGDTVLIRPGAVIPVDGIVVSGGSWIEESMMSGEPVPVFRKTGDPVLAGTINKDSVLQVTTLKTGKETTLARIIAMVDEAQNSKPPVQLLVDKISTVFVPAVILISIATFIIWALIIPDQPLTYAIVTSISVLIIACPCALGLATPTALIAAIGHGAGKGILFRDARSIETAGKTDILVIDKTGTLTKGKPELLEVLYPGNGPQDQINGIFSALTSLSAHPLSSAVAGGISTESTVIPEVEEFTDLPGKGISGKIEGKQYFAGSPAILKKAGIFPEEKVSGILSDYEKQAASLVFLTDSSEVLAIAALSDTLRDDAVQAVEALRNAGIEPFMVTGDNQASAAHIARLAGISRFRAAASPEEKAAIVSELQANGHRVAVAGDGINDTIALARADAGIAMGGGTDASREAAGITLTGHHLMQVAETILLSRKTNKIIKENLFWAFGYNVIAIPLAAGVLFPFTGLLLNPMIASAAMAFSSVSVVLNSLRLR